jgi:hypothetical protein
MKDFTKMQATRWVAQEADKHTTTASRQQRIASEQALCVRLVTAGMEKEFPNSFQAHCNLIKALMAAN